MSNQTLKEEQRLRKIIRKGLLALSENKKKQVQYEQRLQKILYQLIKEVKNKLNPRFLLTEKEEKEIHASTGINDLEDVLKSIKTVSKDGYRRLTTSPDQRKAFIATWKWLFKAAFSGDVKLRQAAEEAAKRIDQGGFEAPEVAEEETIETEGELVQEVFNVILEQEAEKDKDDDEKVIMKITDPDLQTEIPPEPEPTEEEEQEMTISDLVTAPSDIDKSGPASAVKVFNATKKQVLRVFDDLSGKDAEDFYKWFFINMLGSKNSGFEDESIKPVAGHFQWAENELMQKGIETSPELLPNENPDDFNISAADFGV